MTRFVRWCVAVLTIPAAAAAVSAFVPIDGTGPRASLELYALDCGRIDIGDMALFSDTGEHAGEPGEMFVSCFLVRHPDGDLLWETGLGDEIASLPDGRAVGSERLRVPTTLASQLARLGLEPSDIRYVAFSHFHFDHTGNAPLFAGSTWLVNRRELEWSQGTPVPFGVDPAPVRGHPADRTVLLDGDHDVFGDGSVRILRTPGHTPGHQSLLVRLPRSGTVILSGDLYHTVEHHEKSLIPPINTSRAETLASMDRIARILRNTQGRLIVQHDGASITELPRFPAYLD